MRKNVLCFWLFPVHSARVIRKGTSSNHTFCSKRIFASSTSRFCLKKETRTELNAMLRHANKYEWRFMLIDAFQIEGHWICLKVRSSTVPQDLCVSIASWVGLQNPCSICFLQKWESCLKSSHHSCWRVMLLLCSLIYFRYEETSAMDRLKTGVLKF